MSSVVKSMKCFYLLVLVLLSVVAEGLISHLTWGEVGVPFAEKRSTSRVFMQRRLETMACTARVVVMMRFPLI